MPLTIESIKGGGIVSIDILSSYPTLNQPVAIYIFEEGNMG